MKATWEKNGAAFEVDGTPTEMAMTLFSRSLYTPNSRSGSTELSDWWRNSERGHNIRSMMKLRAFVFTTAMKPLSAFRRQTERLLRSLKREANQ